MGGDRTQGRPADRAGQTRVGGLDQFGSRPARPSTRSSSGALAGTSMTGPNRLPRVAGVRAEDSTRTNAASARPAPPRSGSTARRRVPAVQTTSSSATEACHHARCMLAIPSRATSPVQARIAPGTGRARRSRWPVRHSRPRVRIAARPAASATRSAGHRGAPIRAAPARAASGFGRPVGRAGAQSPCGPAAVSTPARARRTVRRTQIAHGAVRAGCGVAEPHRRARAVTSDPTMQSPMRASRNQMGHAVDLPAAILETTAGPFGNRPELAIRTRRGRPDSGPCGATRRALCRPGWCPASRPPHRRDADHPHSRPNVQSPLTVSFSQSTSDGAPFGNRASKSPTSL